MKPKTHKFTFTVEIADSLIEELGETVRTMLSAEWLTILIRDALTDYYLKHKDAAEYVRGRYGNTPFDEAIKIERVKQKVTLALAMNASLDVKKEKST